MRITSKMTKSLVTVSLMVPLTALTGCGIFGGDDTVGLEPQTTEMPVKESQEGKTELAEMFPPNSVSGISSTHSQVDTDDNGVPLNEPPTDATQQDGNATENRPVDDGVTADGNEPDTASAPVTNNATPSLGNATLSSVVSLEMPSGSFPHGDLPADKVKYIVMHDTESGTDSAENIANAWAGGHVAAHFIVNKEGRVIQCVPIDKIAHHAGFADPGSNDRYGIWEERDDYVGRSGSGDYAMNAWSIGIEIVHEHDEGAYPEVQLQALDRLVAAIDSAVGHQPSIIDHKAWGGSRKQDVSDDFPMSAYQRSRRHDG